MAASDYYFFTDTNLLVAQASAGAYGPIAKATSTDPDEYRVTSLHTATSHPTAYAACDAIVCVQRIPGTSLLNIILKPLVQPALNFAPVKYIIYKGILASSLIATNGTDIAPSATNQLTKFAWDEQAKKNKSAGTNAAAPANALGIGLTGASFADIDPIDNLFYRVAVTFQLLKVNGGWSIGQFDKNQFGMEVLMEGLNFHHTIKLARQIESKISVPLLATGATDAKKFDHWHDKEQVLGFMDPCAFYGSFFLAGIQAKTSGSTSFVSKAGNGLYQDALFSFANRNTAYLDIRNEHNFSLNYFKNYGNSITLNYDPANPDPPAADYYASNWPILTLTASSFPAANTVKARNAFRIQLPEGDNPQPLVYVSQGYRDINSKGDGFPAELTSAERFFDAFLTPAGGFTATNNGSGLTSMTFVVPNVTGQAATTPVSCYIRLKYLKQEQGAATAPTVIKAANYLDNLVYPFDLRVLPSGNESIKSSVYEEEVYVNGKNVAGLQCDFIGKVGIAQDANNTSFWVVPTSVRASEGQASALVTLCGETSESPESYPNVIALKYPQERVRKSDLLLSSGTVPVAEFVSDADAAAAAAFGVPDFRKVLSFMVPNTTYSTWKQNIAATGAALDNRFRIYLGIENLFRGTDLKGAGYMSFELVLRGFALDVSTGNYKVSAMNTAP